MYATNCFIVFSTQGGRIRFKVVAEQFVDTTPAGPNLAAGDSAVADRKEGKVPYIVYVSIRIFLYIELKLNKFIQASIYRQENSQVVRITED